MTPEEIIAAIRDALRAGGHESLAHLFEDSVRREVLELHSNVKMELYGPDGALKDTREFHNTICTMGKNLLLASDGTAKYVKSFAYVAIGTGTNAASAADTGLQTEATRAAAAVSNPSASTIQFVTSFGPGSGTGAITESGLLDAGAAGNILARQVFAVLNKGALDTLVMTWTIS